MTRPEHEVTNISSIQLESDANMMLHAIHNLELSLKNPSLGIDVLGNIKKSVNLNPFSLCLVKNVAAFPRLHAAIGY